MIQSQDKISSIFHPPRCSCCGGGIIKFGSVGGQDASERQAIFNNPNFGFSGGESGVTLITEADIQARKSELGLSGNDWSYISSLFNTGGDYYDGVFFKWGGAL